MNIAFDVALLKEEMTEMDSEGSELDLIELQKSKLDAVGTRDHDLRLRAVSVGIKGRAKRRGRCVIETALARRVGC